MRDPHPQPSESTQTPLQGTIERRRRARIHSTTQGWLIPDLPDPAAAPEPWEVKVNDISRFGVGFESTEKMQAGEHCRIRIGRGPMRLARRIRIVSCRAGSDGHYLIGSEFLSLDPDE